MKKRMISLLLCVVMLIGLLPTSALAVTFIGENDTPLNESAKQCWTDKDGFSYYYFAFQEEAEVRSPDMLFFPRWQRRKTAASLP